MTRSTHETAARADQTEARFWAAVARNRNLSDATRGWGAVPVAGGYAIALPGTPVVTTLGAGTARPLADDDLAILAEFFGARDLEARVTLPEGVAEREAARFAAAGYVEAGASVVVEADLGAIDVAPSDRVDTTTDRGRWIEAYVAASGDAQSRTWATVAASSARRLFTVVENGEFAAVAALGLVGGAAFLFAAATREAARRRGHHRALVVARLAAARAEGASWAFGSAPAGSAALRNALAAGLRPVHTRTSWRAATSRG